MKPQNIGSLQATLELKKINNKVVPFQNGIPYPSFEPQNRLIKSLAGKWKKLRFNADHDWSMMLRNQEWVDKTEKQSSGVISTSYDDSEWSSHLIPLPENKLTGKEEVNGAETYENGVWYRKSFVLNDSWDEKIITLKCLALSYIGDFWINDKYVGYHEGGYTPFSFDITKFVRKGENKIVVRVDNPPWTTRVDTIPAQNNDFFNYTGIIHDIYLEATEGVHVVRTDITPKNINGDIDVSVVIENRTKQFSSVTLTGAIFDTDETGEAWLSSPLAETICNNEIPINGLNEKTITLSPMETQVVNYQLTIPNPKLWSIRKPNLYVFKISLRNKDREIDKHYTQFGIRTIKTNETKICLNEQPIFLAGVARHEEWPQFGRTASWERIIGDFLKIKDLSVNMVRTAHYPNHIYTFLVLDRLGITAMSEIPLWQFEKIHYEVQEERQISYQMFREMVFSNFNRPSIIMWSTQNESKEVRLRKIYNQNLADEIRTLYKDGRLITQSAAADQPGFEDESMEPLDVLGWTMYFGIFHGSTPYEGTRNFIEKAHQKWPNKPIINTEYGIWSNADNSFLDKQVEIYRDVQLALLEKATVSPQGIVNDHGYIAGMDYWTAFDWFVNHNQFYQTMGMLRMDRKTTKPLYQYFVNDHQRLTAENKGFGIIQKYENMEKLKIKEKQISKGSVKFSFEHSVDLTKFNYLKISVFDAESRDSLSVKIKNEQNKEVTYKTYHIVENIVFEVFVPLWTLDAKIIANTNQITIAYESNRKIEIRDIDCTMAGT
ncbi:glycoside hydrolase family 2 TIM barrel-domain containing protein [Lederbergia graminis]|uniref:Glycoside hydrolase family 2 TIM barrel-domain containing protein n=1 Tax=Lederbergia graminis TaxID=735518 RepID=A0ABW0LDT9_9BACI